MSYNYSSFGVLNYPPQCSYPYEYPQGYPPGFSRQFIKEYPQGYPPGYLPGGSRTIKEYPPGYPPGYIAKENCEIYPDVCFQEKLQHLGHATVLMRQNLQLKPFREMTPDKQFIIKNNIYYEILSGFTENYSQKPLVSIGRFPESHEVISVNMNRPFSIIKQKLEDLKEILLTNFHNSNATLKKLSCITHFISINIFFQNYSHPEEVDRVAKDWANQENLMTIDGRAHSLVPLDNYVRNGLGVCRHHALLTAIFLDSLIKEKYLNPGTVHYVRDTVPGGGHAWVVYKEYSGAQYHIDTLWNKLGRLDDPTFLQSLVNEYGLSAMRNTSRRFLLNLPL